ncbi:hypothetical protein YTPLAS18_35380 [Nitrospira sp.]|nr:hypothetical protein YTPLAS18_35380 [Nitrospira sp.]
MTRVHASLASFALCVGTIGFASAPDAAWAESSDIIAIAKVLSDPAPFNLDIVTLVGTIREIRTIPVETECGGGAGQVYFLRDETGELAIRDLGACVQGSYIPVLASDIARGDRVRVRVAIAVHPEASEERPPLDAVLVRIGRTSD